MIALLALPSLAGEVVLVAPGSTWRYLDTGVDPGPGWTDAAFDDSGWATGAAPLGYGLAALGTTVAYGPDPLNRYVTTWFRQDFTATGLTGYEAFSVELRRDDGAVVYVNGQEVYRTNLPAGAITPTTLATTGVYGLDQDTFLEVVLPSTALLEGDNVVAVELHQQVPSSADLVMDLGISAWNGPTAVTRGPYLQRTTSDGALIRWRTDGPSAARLLWGTAPGALTSSADDPTIAFDHAIEVTGAAAASLVTYAVGTPSGLVLAGDDLDHRFRTAPVAGATDPLRVWVLGDSGTANVNAQAVRDAYLSLYPDPLDTDVWLMLGDNAYPSGTVREYDTAVFDFYPDHLRQVALWPSLGNHDGYSAYSDTQTGPYFDLFTLPTQGEAGGEPSGTEAYWSFDHGNVHFVDLDSYHSERTPGSAMLTWLEADLAATTADWVIVMFHHPPYSKGSHDSDTELEMVEMREHVLPILEAHGVDLVLTGHSHSYERTFLLDGHYDVSSTFDRGLMALQDHDGDPLTGGAYTKWPPGIAPHQGAVYVVAGSSGQISGGPLNHPAMHVSLNTLGSMVLDIDGLELEAIFLDALGVVADRFAIHKGVTTIVQLEGDTIGAEGELLGFEGLAYEADGTEPPLYTWDWGDGTPDAVGPAATHSWAAEGAYTVTLSVTDTIGFVAADTLVVNIDNAAPVIDQLEHTPDPVEGSPVTFTGHATDPAADPITYSWVIDGSTYVGDVVVVTFTDDGPVEATLTALDDAGRTDVEVLSLEVANAAPTIDGFIAVEAFEGSLATLSAEVDDPGVDALTTTWTVAGLELPGAVVQHTFPTSGSWPATIHVADDDGGESSLDVTVLVANAHPTVLSPAFEGDLVEGGAITFRASATDPGGDPVTLSWDFADGSPLVVGDEVQHVFPDQGPWPARVIAQDGDGGYDVEALEVHLENLPPSIVDVLAPPVADEGVEQVFEVLATDPGAADVMSARWTFGDGGSAEGLIVHHVYDDEGERLVTVELSDDEGASDARELPVTVRNAAPTLLAPPEPLRMAPGRTWSWRPQVHDVDPVTLSLAGPDGALLAHDGTIEWRTPDEPGTAGAFALTADDGEGGVSTWEWSVQVAGISAAPDHRLDREDALACGCSSPRPAAGAWLLISVVWARSRRGRRS